MDRNELHTLLEEVPEAALDAIGGFLNFCKEHGDGPAAEVLVRVWSQDVEKGLPLHANEQGVIRVGKTRVSLASVIGSFRQGSSAEEIQQQFPTLALEDIYWVIAYYLRHRESVEEYLKEQEEQAERLREEWEKRFPPEGLRERLLARIKSAS